MWTGAQIHKPVLGAHSLFSLRHGPNISGEYNDWCSPLTSLYPQSSEIPRRQPDPIGIQSVHFSHTGWCPVSWSCDCLLSVSSPEREEEHLSLGREERRGDLHLSSRWTVCRRLTQTIHIQGKWEVAHAVSDLRAFAMLKMKNSIASCGAEHECVH